MTQLAAPRTEEWRYAPPAVLAEIWPVAVEEIALAPGESGALVITQRAGQEPLARQLLLVLGEGAQFDLALVNLGGSYSRIAVEARLARGARLSIGGVQLASADEKLEIVTEVIHEGPNATSRQVIRSVAGAMGEASYLGKVRVERGADGTDGEQSVRAMLLDRSAQANARPELEIFADDVKCAHGCAVGELDANGLFYLASRGIEPARAKALMLSAFIAEGLAGVENEALIAATQARLEELL